jgi:hypothetical protein
MSETNGTTPEVNNVAVRDEWIAAVNELVTRVEGWCKELDWATRRSPKRIKDKALGTFDVPMLLMQQWDAKLLLSPINRFVGGEADGRVDLYTMPEYDDVAVLIRRNGDWQMRVQLGKDERDFVPFSRDTFKEVIETFARRHAEA